MKIGILDPEGKNTNPMTNEPYSENYKQLAKFWSKLPAYENAEKIISALDKNQITLVISGTGSGKTVLLPKYLLHVFNYNKKIAVTLPKQIIAKSSAEFAAETLDVQLGKDVAYKYKGSDKKGYSADAKLLYATDGTIVSKLMNDPELREFDGVIIDEAHERKVQIDFLLFLLKNTIKMRKDFKLVIMSATVNEQVFVDYFKEFNMKVIDVGAKTNYPIESKFISEPITEKQYIEKGYEIIKKIVSDNTEKKDEYKDILFFVTSSNEAKTLCEKVNLDKLDVYCVEVYSGMNAEKESIAKDRNLFKKESDKSRKLVIATNVAESSLTIDGIKYVIDSGFEIFGYFDPIQQAKVLGKRLITRAQAKQRMGRAGRTAPGVCYHLYTKDQFENKMEKFPEPTIRTSDITEECLNLLALPNIQSVDKLLNILMQLIEPPRESYIKMALNKLNRLALIKDSQITPLGMIISDMQTDINESLAILMGKLYNCSKELCAIFSLTDAIKKNISELFVLPSIIAESDSNGVSDGNNNNKFKHLNNKFKDAQSKLAHNYGDHLSLLKIFTKIREYKQISKHEERENKINEFCYKYFIKRSAINKAFQQYHRLKDSLYNITCPFQKDDKIFNSNLEDRILYCITFGFNINIAHLNSDKESYNTSGIKRLAINKNSFFTLKNKNNPNEILYHSLLVNAGKNEMTIVSKKSNLF